MPPWPVGDAVPGTHSCRLPQPPVLGTCPEPPAPRALSLSAERAGRTARAQLPQPPGPPALRGRCRGRKGSGTVSADPGEASRAARAGSGSADGPQAALGAQPVESGWFSGVFVWRSRRKRRVRACGSCGAHGMANLRPGLALRDPQGSGVTVANSQLGTRLSFYVFN